jgi:hypothetical protein
MRQGSRKDGKEFTLERNGFQIVPFETEVKDFRDKMLVKSTYYLEVAELIKKV